MCARGRLRGRWSNGTLPESRRNTDGTPTGRRRDIDGTPTEQRRSRKGTQMGKWVNGIAAGRLGEGDGPCPPGPKGGRLASTPAGRWDAGAVALSACSSPRGIFRGWLGPSHRRDTTSNWWSKRGYPNTAHSYLPVTAVLQQPALQLFAFPSHTR